MANSLTSKPERPFEGRIGVPGFRVAWAEMDCGYARGVAVEIGSWRRGWRWKVRA